MSITASGNHGEVSVSPSQRSSQDSTTTTLTTASSSSVIPLEAQKLSLQRDKSGIKGLGGPITSKFSAMARPGTATQRPFAFSHSKAPKATASPQRRILSHACQ